MREIRFRVWDQANCSMTDDPFEWEDIAVNFPDGDERYVWMQYTGLKDRNGTEIYELMEVDNKYRVIYDSCSYVLQDISSGDIIGLLDNSMVKANEREVTGEYSPMEKD